jgi:protoheme IX farnesyltransferase
MFKVYSDLTKFGIVIFVVLSGIAGYATSFAIENIFDWQHFLNLVGGLFFLSSGSLALNQVQEYKIDLKMPRTAKRPIPSGRISPAAASILAVAFLLIGSDLLFQCSEIAGVLGWLTVLLYNVVYTYWWKPKWIFAAIPGAIPGALPVTIGYAANDSNLLNLDSVYLFLILFLWQMPHFWALAIRFKDDYQKGGVPTLPAALGIHKTLYHMGLWTFFYVVVAIASPWFVHASWVYMIAVFPFAFKVLQEFYRFFKSNAEKRWLAFFMWVNLSVLIFLFVPVVDKWSFLLQGSR